MKALARITKAELIKRLKALEKGPPAPSLPLDQERLLHELQVHQIELETQNRELREAQLLLENSRDRYADLYDFAPIGFTTLNDKGVILEINLTAAGMLGLERTRLLGVPFHLNVMPEDLAIFREHLAKLSTPDERVTTELRLTRKGGGVISVVIQSVLMYVRETQCHLCRCAITDVTARKQAEEAMRASQERLEQALAGAELGFWDRDLGSSKIVLNPRWAEGLGYPVEEASAKGFSWEALVHPDDLPRANEALAAHLSGHVPLYEAVYRMRAKSGEWRWVLSRGKTVARDAAGKPLRLAGTYLDIHRRKQAEEALRNNEARLNAILETAVEGILTVNDRGLIELFNPAAAAMFGYTAGEVIGQEIRFLLPSLDRAQDYAYITNYQATGERKVVGMGRETLGRRKDGSTFPLDFSVSKVQLADQCLFTAILRDITRRKEAEEALRRSEKNLVLAQKVAHVGSYEFDIHHLERFHWSEETLRILGLDPAKKELSFEEYLARVVHPEDRLHVCEELARTIDQAVGHDMHYRIVRPDGSIRHVHSIAERTLGPDKKLLGVVGSLQDITEHKELEKQILEISEREQSRIGQDLHDGLCQQLAGIEFRLLGLKQNLQGKSKPQAAETASIAKLVREAIEQTRTLARGLSPVIVSPDGLMAALRELAINAEKAFKISCSLNCPTPVLIHDNAVASHLYRIAQEATHNAVRHGKANFIVLNLFIQNDHITLGVRDDGVGFSRKPRKHTGMGLRVMHFRADMIGASLVVQREAEGGISVICVLRSPAAPGGPTPPSPNRKKNSPGKHER